MKSLLLKGSLEFITGLELKRSQRRLNKRKNKTRKWMTSLIKMEYLKMIVLKREVD